MAKMDGTANPNYRHGNYCGDFGTDPMDNISLRLQLQDKLRELLDMNLEHQQPTPVEHRWLLAVIDERPEWAHVILEERGFKRGFKRGGI